MINSTNGTCFTLDQSWLTHLRHRKRRLCWWSVSRGLRGISSTRMLTRLLVTSRSVQSFTWHKHLYLHNSPLHERSARASSLLVFALDGVYTCSSVVETLSLCLVSPQRFVQDANRPVGCHRCSLQLWDDVSASLLHCCFFFNDVFLNFCFECSIFLFVFLCPWWLSLHAPTAKPDFKV